MTDAEHRAMLAKLFGSVGQHTAVVPTSPTVAPLTSATPGIQPPSASDILKRLRQKSAPPPPDPLRIIRSGRDCKLKIARWTIGIYWWVEFNRPFLMPELDRAEDWCAANCSGAFLLPSDTIANTMVRFYDEIDWNLFITVFK